MQLPLRSTFDLKSAFSVSRAVTWMSSNSVAPATITGYDIRIKLANENIILKEGFFGIDDSLVTRIGAKDELVQLWMSEATFGLVPNELYRIDVRGVDSAEQRADWTTGYFTTRVGFFTVTIHPPKL